MFSDNKLNKIISEYLFCMLIILPFVRKENKVSHSNILSIFKMHKVAKMRNEVGKILS